MRRTTTFMTDVSPAPRVGARPLPARGVLVPLVTPLNPDGSVDLDSLTSLIDFTTGSGVDGVLVLGSSGEWLWLAAAERMKVAARATAYASSLTHVMLGVPHQGTADSADAAAKLGALDPGSLLVSAPAGDRPSPAELVRHYEQIAVRVDVPLIAYEVPSRVGTLLGPDLIRRLAEAGTIAGVKDSSGDIVGGRMISQATRHLPGFVSYTGCEQCIDASMLGGFSGAIPGLANVFPEFHVALMGRAAVGDWSGAAEIQNGIIGLMDLYFHPLPGASFSAQFFAVVKEALVQRGIIAHATTSRPLTQSDDGIRSHAAALLERGAELRERILPLRLTPQP